MATSYTGLRVQDTYNAIIKIGDNSNLTGTAKLLSDGLGNDSPLYLSSTRLGIGISPSYQFHTSGNAKIGGDVIISGDLTVNGDLTYLNVTDLAVEDPLIKLAKDNTSNTLDIGFFGKYVESSTTKYTGLFWDASTDKFRLFEGLQDEPTTTVDPTGTGYTRSLLNANLEGNVTGTVSSLSNHDTNDLVEGSVNLYFTTNRARASFTAGTGVTISNGEIAIGQAVATTSNVTFGNITGSAISGTTGTFSGQVTIPETPTADAHAASKKYVDDNTGDVDVAKRIEITVKNVSGSTLVKGAAVHASPTATPPSGNVIEVIGADNDVTASMPSIGILNEEIADEAEGQCVMVGSVTGINTSSFTAGQELYVGSTPGVLTNTKPTSTSNQIQKIAVVIKSHASNGQIEVFGAGRANDVPNLVDRTITFDPSINVTASQGFGRIEIGGPSGGYIDLKAPASDDYDMRFIVSQGGNEITTNGGDLKINTGNTLALTLDGSNQNATFAGDVTATSKKLISTSSSSGDYVRMYGGSGTAQWDIYGNGENLRVSENSGGGGHVDIDTSLNVDSGLSAAAIGISGSNGTDGKGISLYGGANSGEPTYGMMFQQTSSFGTFGYVSGDWATYFTMNSSSNRGWIFRNVSTSTNVASINNQGQAHFQTPSKITSNDTSLTFEDAGTNAMLIKVGAGDELYIGSNNTYQFRGTTVGQAQISSNGYLNLTSGASNYAGIEMYQTDGSRVGYFYGDGGSGSTPSIGILDSDGNWALRAVRDSYVEFRVNNVIKLQTTTSINYNYQPTWIEGGSADWDQTTPGTSTGSLHLVPSSTDNFGSAITFGASDRFSGTNAQAGIYTRSDGTYGTKMYFATTGSYASGSKNGMMIDYNGNVGVNTSNPLSKFVVSEGTDQHGIELAPGTLSYLQCYDRATSTYGNMTIDAKYLAFGLDNGAEKIRFTADGHVGIGTDSPYYSAWGSNSKQLTISGTDYGLINLIDTGGPTRFAIGAGDSKLYLAYDDVAGAHRIVVSSSGNVGIGPQSTGTLNNKLQVSTGVDGDGIILTGIGDNTGIANGSYRKIGFRYDDTDESFESEIRFVVTNASAHGGQMEFFTDDTGGVKTRAITITNAQRVGIGTESPARKFHVSNAANGNIALFTNTVDADLNINLTSGVTMLAPSTGIIALGTSNTERMRIDSFGQTKFLNRVEIQAADTGTNPSSGTTARLIIDNNSNTNGCIAVMDFRNYSTFVTARIGAQFQDADDKNTDLYFMTRANGGTLDERMRITSNGNVGIGTESPAQKLEVATTGINQSTTVRIQGTDGNGNGHPLDLKMDGATDSFSILIGQGGGATPSTVLFTGNRNGNVGIGVSPQSDARLHTYRNSTDAFNIFESSANKWVFGEAGGVCQVGGKYGTHSGIQINTSGNVGIGSSPSSAAGVANFLSVRGSSHAGIVLQDTDGGAIHEMWNDGGTLNMWDSSVGYRIRFYTSGDAQAYNGWGAASLGITGSNGNDGKGLSLYGGAAGGEPTYGMMFMQTATFGTYGSVSGDYATYFTMNNNASRGWIFRRVGNANYASISGGGDLSLSGQVLFPTTNQRIAGLNGTYLQIKSGSASDGGINLVNTSGTNLVYLYGNGSDCGIINSGGYWAFRHTQGGHTYLYAGNQSYNWRFQSSNGYAYFPSWINLSSGTGLFTGSNGGHFYGNEGSTYGAWRTSGSRNGYSGIYDNHSATNVNMMDSSGNGGNYHSTSGWHFYYNRANLCLGIGNSTTSSSYSLYVTGSIYSTADVIAYSDKRAKENIVTVDSAIEKVNKLRGVYYTPKEGKDKSRKVGVIAQEILQVLPEVVTYDNDNDKYGVDYGKITGLLIEAIKDQQKQIDKLTKFVDKLNK